MQDLIIKNREQIISNAENEVFKKLRSDSLEIVEASIASVDPERAVKNKLKRIDNLLKTEDLILNLNEINKIIVLGGGKASIPMSKAVEDLIQDRIYDGIINTLHENINYSDLKIIKINGAAHPVPDESGVKGVNSMMSIVSDLNEDDLVIALISGGGSSLMPLPAENINLKDIQEVTNDLLKAGATINELNAVRKHISSFKGGQLARKCYPARVVALILSDVIGDSIDTIASGPTAPDDTTFLDAMDVLKKYGTWEMTPQRIKIRIQNGVYGKINETPKTGDKIFNKTSNFIVANNLTAVKAGEKKATNLGYKTHILSTFIEGEAKQLGLFLAGIAKSIVKNGNPLSPPAAIIIGGETTVKVLGQGKGGRNQEVALSSTQKIDGLNVLILALGTDGIDGPTEAAGAIVDGNTLKKAKRNELVPSHFLNNNDSYHFFKEMQDFIITGPTGTNVNDISIILAK